MRKRASLGLLLVVLIGWVLLPHLTLGALSWSQVQADSESDSAAADSKRDHWDSADRQPYSAAALPSSPGPFELGLESLSESGVLEPRLVTQRAVCSSEDHTLRTDTSPLPAVDLPVDRGHDWLGSQVNVAVENMQRLYVLNGTFGSGVNGTNENGGGSARPTGWVQEVLEGGDQDQIQRTAYDNSSGTVMVQNQGGIRSGPRYFHGAGTYAAWTQIVTLNPLTDQFYLRFNFLYRNGPLGGSYYRDRVYLRVWYGTSRVWTLDLIYAGVRNQWLDTGLLGINRTTSSPFTFKIGIYVANDVYLDPSYSSVGTEANARYLTVLLDNVTLTAASKPYPSEVDLHMQVTAIAPLAVNDTGPGRGSAAVSHSYWETEVVTVAFTSNTSILFDCFMTLKLLKTKYSAWQLASGSDGVGFDVVNGSSVNLSLWTDVAYPSIYQSFEFSVTFPSDWENVTVFDSYPSDVTSQCVIGSDYLLVNGSTAQQLGWWHITFQGRNYARSAAIQLFVPAAGSWQNETVYRCINRTRAVGSIGTDSIVPEPLADIILSWNQPNGTIWAQEALDGEPNGSFLGSNHCLGQTNTSAGVWIVQILWSNGTEVAFRTVAFGLYHRTSLDPYYTEEQTEPGMTIMGAVHYKDSDTNQPILEPAAIVLANWSTTSISLAANPVRRQWEAEFNPDVVGLGVHVVRVNATCPFYDEAHCYFTIQVSYNTQLTSPNEPWDQTEWGTVRIIELVYKFCNRTSEPIESWQGVDNATGETRVTCNWTIGSWAVHASDGPGTYHLSINTAALPSGTWLLNITMARPGYAGQELSLTLLAFVISPVMKIAWLIPVLFAALLIVVVGLLASRLVRRHRAAEQVLLLASRQEFEDARNVVTVIILNKSNGMPIYSSYSREGVRKELLAAFVSAISHFRQEIVVNEHEELFRLIPISDVVYMCATRTLLCALVTLMPPSERLKEKLVQFTKSMDREFDELLRQRDGLPIEGIVGSTLHEVVQKSFGLRLLSSHVADPSQHVPRQLRQVMRIAKADFPRGGIDLIQLSRSLQSQGRREKVAYHLILQAVRKGVLVALPAGPTPELEPVASEQD